MMKSYIGVMGYQGGSDLHIKALNELGIPCKKIFNQADFFDLRGLILPGGESSVQSLFLKRNNLGNTIIEFANNGNQVLGTCAGCILLSHHLCSKVQGLNLLDIEIERNIYGAQIESGKKISDKGREVLFIRAPGILKVGNNVSVLDSYNNSPIFVKQNNIYATTFHPEALNVDAKNILAQIFM